MDFSSANVPISRETWAPRSPPRGAPTQPSAPSGNGHADESRDGERGGYDSRPSRGEDYDGRDSRDSRRDYDSRPPPPRDDSYRRDDRPSYNGRDAGGQGGPRRPVHAPAKVDPNPVLGVFGLSIRTRERDLDDEFSRYGEVEKVVIVYDQRTDRSRGFGFITMRSTADAERCVDKLNGFMLHGRPIRVDFSATQKAHQPTPGQYMGEKRPLRDDRGYRRYDDRRDDRRYDDRRDRRYDDRGRDRDYSSRRDHDDPYGGRSRRDDDRRRSPSPRRARHSHSPDRRAPPPAREYEAAAPAGDASRY
ncbi:hypothetical protein BD324DRAFT_465696 [Kockovaella imperatae]|uniref:RRM domain-containing protein n=1 Tax=Kockovaella imperatae TaxID=4999 RepID=A0A1Y1UFB6_9TREE|nr:hypothetical protein BD324DRAFT_465696 [Kockovaella imperatae]ORX36751.1 hypothetical protein BD324DRAFT_465696 [Kockovaella imperatae]